MDNVNIPSELKYTQTHEWVRLKEDGTAIIGITDYAQSHLGELVFVQLPTAGVSIHADDEVCVVESVKAADDVYSPLSGIIVAVNEDLEEAPNFVNSDPYGDGWLYTIKISDKSELAELLDAKGYRQYMQSHEE